LVSKKSRRRFLFFRRVAFRVVTGCRAHARAFNLIVTGRRFR